MFGYDQSMTERIRPVRDEDIWNFKIDVRGQMNEDDLNTGSPFQITLAEPRASSMLITIRTDQSGLVGMIRYLHHRGIVLLSINREE